MGVLSEENGWLVSSHIHEASPSRMSSLSLKKEDTKNVNGKKVLRKSCTRDSIPDAIRLLQQPKKDPFCGDLICTQASDPRDEQPAVSMSRKFESFGGIRYCR
jgi:hypothetical protein